jgi:hypothetical protein
MLLFVKLALVPAEDKDTERRPQGMNAAGKAARPTGEASQVVTQFGIVTFNRIGLALVRQHPVLSRISVHKRISGKGVTEEDARLGRFINHLLQEGLAPIWLHRPIDDAACIPINMGYDEDLVFFSPMKV